MTAPCIITKSLPFVTVWKSGKNSGGCDYCSWGYTFLSRNKCRGVASETHPRWRPRWCVRSKRQHQSMRRLRILCLWQASLRAAMLETQLTRSSSSCLLVVGIQLSAATCCSGVYTLRLLSKWVWTEQYTRAPNRDKCTEWDGFFFWWTVPPLICWFI